MATRDHTKQEGASAPPEVVETVKTMLAECEVPAAWEGLGVEVSGCTNLWVSTRGLVSPLHYDATHSFLAQVLLCLSVHVSVCVCVCDDAAQISGTGAFFLLAPFHLHLFTRLLQVTGA